MSKIEVISFQDALKQSEVYNKRHLLLGNGFSIACIRKVFCYESLFSQADLDKFPELRESFELLETKDFEVVSYALEKAALILPAYDKTLQNISKKMRKDSQKIKEILIETIAKNHPENPTRITDEQFRACRKFLAHFLDTNINGAVYTVSYDLLLYWTLMHKEEEEPFKIEPCDGFGKDTFLFDGDVEISEYVTWQGESRANDQNIHYLHGALHLYKLGKDIEKYTWSNTGETLINQALMALRKNKFPIFVSEGESEKKLEKIRQNIYLFHSYKSLHTRMGCKGTRQLNDCLFTFGFSFSDNDEHIFKKIAEGRILHLFVGIRGSITDNSILIENTQKLKRFRHPKSPLEISYYDADSANVWGNSNA